MAKIAYITSGKFGIHSFTHNEITELVKDHEIFLCLTQLNSGPFMPKSEWKTFIASKKKVTFSLLKLLLTKPFLFIKLLIFASKNNIVLFLFISIYFYLQLKSEKINSIHCQMGDHKLFIGYFLKLIMDLPLTVTIHAHELYQHDVYDAPDKFKNLYKACDKVITISDFNKNILEKEFGITKEKIEVMRLFPEMKRINKLLNKKKILIVANWIEKKGYRTLVSAIKKLKRKDYLLLVVGGTNLSENSVDLEDLVRNENLDDKIVLLGRLGGPQLDIVFSTSDIFCLPSITEYYNDGKPAEREGIPVALMEAMAWGKPVISTIHAGIPELVEELLIKENDVDELINALNYLLDHPEKWDEMGKRNQEIIKEKYHSGNIKRLNKIFNDFSGN